MGFMKEKKIINITSSGIAIKGKCILYNISVTTNAIGSIGVRDGLNTNGVRIINVTINANRSENFSMGHKGCLINNGLFIVLSVSGMSISLEIEELND